MTDNNTFTGWTCTAKGKELVQMELKLREWDENCVQMDVTHCGICGSDIHTLDSGWGPTDYPCVVGHEIIGVVTKVGKNVTNLKVGDRAGVGPHSHSCHECSNCLEGNDNVCERGYIGTYGSRWPNGDKTYGGYADKWRGDYRWAFKVPDSMSSEDAACFYCAGVTTYTPLARANVSSKSTVGVMGIGGLGHFGILFAKAMGATVIGMSHNDKKKDVAFELGCDDFINTSDEASMAKYTNKLTHILCTGNGRDFRWETYYALMRVNGQFMNVSAPEWNFPEINPLYMIMNQVSISSSAAGSSQEMQEMLDFAAEKKIKPWIQKYPMQDVNKAIEDFREGKPRFRFVLEN